MEDAEMPSDIGGMPVITDDNAGQFINPVTDGHRRLCSLAPRDMNRYPVGGCGFAALRPFNQYTKTEIIERIKQRDAARSGLRHILDSKGVPVKDQDGIPYCWIYSTVHTMEIAYAVQGDGYLPLSATAAGTLITRGVSRGGYGAEAIDFLSKHGTCREQDWPEHQINLKYHSDKIDQMAENNMITDWGELPSGNLDQLAAAVLNNFPVTIGLQWWGHQVTIIDVVLLPGDVIGFVFNNSWGTRWGDNGRGVLTPQKARGDMFYPISVRPRSEVVRSTSSLLVHVA